MIEKPCRFRNGCLTKCFATIRHIATKYASARAGLTRRSSWYSKEEGFNEYEKDIDCTFEDLSADAPVIVKEDKSISNKHYKDIKSLDDLEKKTKITP
jgi:hypothetical protein